MKPLGQLQVYQHSHHRGARRISERARNWKLFEKTVKEKFPNLVKKIDMQVQEAHRVPDKMNARRPTPRHIIIKMPKVKGKVRILKAAGEKQLVTYGGVPTRLSTDFSKETLQARRDWQQIFKVKKSRDLQPKLFYSAKISFRIK